MSQPVSAPFEQCIVVAGAYRSGTAILSDVLVLLGGRKAQSCQSEGHGARRNAKAGADVASLAAGLAGVGWDDWATRVSAPDPAAETALHQYVSGLSRQETGVSNPAVLAEPQICRVIGPLDTALHKAAMSPAYLVMLRAPDEVALSLARQDGFSRQYGVALWTSYMLAVERATRGMVRAFVSFDALLTDWRRQIDAAVSLTGLHLPDRGIARAEAEVDAHLVQARRNHMRTTDGRAPATATERIAHGLYSALCRLAADPADQSALRQVDDLAAEWTTGWPITVPAEIANSAAPLGDFTGRLAASATATDFQLDAERLLLDAELTSRRLKAFETLSETAAAPTAEILYELAQKGGAALIGSAIEIEKLEAVLAAARIETAEAALQRDAARKTTMQLSEVLTSVNHRLQLSTMRAEAAFARPAKTFRRQLVSGFLRRLSELKSLPGRRRDRFRKSASKRDPMGVVHEFRRLSADIGNELSRPQFADAQHSALLARCSLKITAIVPNYNHARFLGQRLDSILNQTYPHIDVIVLDDCSTDDSRGVIDSYVARYPDRIRTIYNDANSGSVFEQWRRGYHAAQGDLVWFCESDDFCEPDFAARLVVSFLDPSVMIAFGDIQFARHDGSWMDGLDQYRENAEPGIWTHPLTRPASQWFAGGFGVSNVIANVGGCIWRRIPIADRIWEQAKTYRIMGDWYLYSEVSGTGQIAYDPAARAYFRQHLKNTSVKAQATPEYYREYSRLMTELKARWPVPEETFASFVQGARAVFDAQPRSAALGQFDDLLNQTSLAALPRTRPHVLIVFLGFSFGGGELFPINLANALHALGVPVSMLQLMTTEDRDEVRGMLNPAIPVYEADKIAATGIGKFLHDSGVSVIHSHIVSAEMFFFETYGVQTDLPYVATLHGSYEAMHIEPARATEFARHVSRWVYTTDRNLEAIRHIGVPAARIEKMANGMPVDARSFAMTRAEMGIADDAVVFALVARGIQRKGWRVAVNALKRLQAAHPDRSVHLLLVGEGELTDQVRKLADGLPNIHFLGYQTTIHGIYRLADVALAPTRFAGESYPLCLIQAMQTGAAVIASDVGEIAAMIRQNGRDAGLLVEAVRDTAQFEDNVLQAMERMLDNKLRNRLREGAAAIGETYAIEEVARRYAALYAQMVAEAAAHAKAA